MEDSTILPRHLRRYLSNPYGGLFGDSVRARVVQEVVADPDHEYRPKELEDMVDASAPSIRGALSTFVKLGLLEKDSTDRQHPTFRVKPDSKKLMALTLLSYAMIDDREGSDLMDDAVLDHCISSGKIERLAMGVFVAMKTTGTTADTRKILYVASTETGPMMSATTEVVR